MSLPSLFNCSNDMALAANVRQYLPPKRIQQMETDLADLVRIWEGTRFAGPWGWSLATKQRYKQLGVEEELLPSDEWIEEVRRLSSREFACGYIRELLKEFQDDRLLGEGMAFCKDMSTLNSLPSTVNCQLSIVNCHLIFKSPWSSSGRGVFVDRITDGKCQMSTLKRLQGFLSSQGGFVVDRFYEDKVLDFAMEFFVNDDKSVDFLGYSVFHADPNGTYGYNYVESQEELLQRIVDGNHGLNGQLGVDGCLLDRLIDYHKTYLSTLICQLSTVNYHGPVGIDMLKTADGHMHPCLEINFRMNMGILALLLYEKYGSHATVALTSPCPSGYRAMIEKGRLQIVFRS
ncbi:MAG: hypothetical protein J6T11_08050 [Bacteroidaceae bacterium]|nr:hypothetical protein [Bacteroidaceae bacterium]